MKILLLRYSALGDVVMTTWTATALKQALPDCEITWAIQPRCAPLVSSALARTALVPRDRGEKNSLKAMLKFGLELRKQKFDWGLDVQGHAKTAIALKLAAPKKRLALRATDAATAFISRPTPAPDHLVHIVEREAWLAAKVANVSLPQLPLMPEPEPLLKSDDQPLITVQMGAGWPGKAYPPELMNQVILKLEKEGCRVVALGGPNDPHPTSGEDWVGRTELPQTLSWLQASSVHLAPDTGTGHMASALGVPLVSIFGPEDPSKCRPWGQNVTVLKEGRRTADVPPELAVSSVLSVLERRK